MACASWQTAWADPPFAAVLGHVQARVQDLQIRQADVAPLNGETVCDLLVLGFGDLHAGAYTKTGHYNNSWIKLPGSPDLPWLQTSRVSEPQ